MGGGDDSWGVVAVAAIGVAVVGDGVVVVLASSFVGRVQLVTPRDQIAMPIVPVVTCTNTRRSTVELLLNA